MKILDFFDAVKDQVPEEYKRCVMDVAVICIESLDEENQMETIECLTVTFRRENVTVALGETDEGNRSFFSGFVSEPKDDVSIVARDLRTGQMIEVCTAEDISLELEEPPNEFWTAIDFLVQQLQRVRFQGIGNNRKSTLSRGHCACLSFVENYGGRGIAKELVKHSMSRCKAKGYHNG